MASANISGAQTSLYILLWPLPPRSGGRRHMALFVPRATAVSSIGTSPSLTQRAATTSLAAGINGTLLQAVGSPFTGYQHAFAKDWRFPGTEAGETEGVRLVGQIDPEALEQVAGAEKEKDQKEGDARAMLLKLAEDVPTPGVNKNPLNPGAVNDCQSWILALITHFFKRGVVGREVVEKTAALVETPETGGTLTASLLSEPFVTTGQH